MSGFIKPASIVPMMALICSGGSLAAAKATKRKSMNNQSYMVRQTLIDLNFDELLYYSFIISINRCHGRRSIW